MTYGVTQPVSFSSVSISRFQFGVSCCHKFMKLDSIGLARATLNVGKTTVLIYNYGLRDALCQDSTITADLQNIRTRLNEFSEREQGQLVNWGYALTDAAMRRWVVPEAAPSLSWPIPTHPL